MSDSEIIVLNDLPFRRLAEVNDLATLDEEARCRLLSLGIYPGVKIEVLRAAPMGDPLQIRSGSTLISIRKSEAALIEVQPCQ